MRTRWLPVLVVALLAGVVITYKQVRKDPPRQGSEIASNSAVSGPSVLIFADPREADSDDPCAEIFRLVRAAGARGLRVSEFAPGRDAEMERRYRVTVEPTVLVLDAKGQVVSRHEGESPKTIEAIRTSLERLPAPP